MSQQGSFKGMPPGGIVGGQPSSYVHEGTQTMSSGETVTVTTIGPQKLPGVRPSSSSSNSYQGPQRPGYEFSPTGGSVPVQGKPQPVGPIPTPSTPSGAIPGVNFTPSQPLPFLRRQEAPTPTPTQSTPTTAYYTRSQTWTPEGKPDAVVVRYGTGGTTAEGVNVNATYNVGGKSISGADYARAIEVEKQSIQGQIDEWDRRYSVNGNLIIDRETGARYNKETGEIITAPTGPVPLSTSSGIITFDTTRTPTILEKIYGPQLNFIKDIVQVSDLSPKTKYVSTQVVQTAYDKLFVPEANYFEKADSALLSNTESAIKNIFKAMEWPEKKIEQGFEYAGSVLREKVYQPQKEFLNSLLPLSPLDTNIKVIGQQVLSTAPELQSRIVTGAANIGTFFVPYLGAIRTYTYTGSLVGQAGEGVIQAQAYGGITEVPKYAYERFKSKPIQTAAEAAFLAYSTKKIYNDIKAVYNLEMIQQVTPSEQLKQRVEPLSRQRSTVILQTESGGYVFGKKHGETISIGGNIEKGESALEAAKREFAEEVKGAGKVKLTPAGKIVTPEETFILFRGVIPDSRVAQLVASSDLSSIVYVPKWRVDLLTSFGGVTGRTRLFPVNRPLIYPWASLRGEEAAMITYLEKGIEPKWLVANTDQGILYLGRKSRYNVPFVKEYDKLISGTYTHGTTEPPILKRTDLFGEKTFKVKASTSMRGEPGLYIQPPSTTGGTVYIKDGIIDIAPREYKVYYHQGPKSSLGGGFTPGGIVKPSEYAEWLKSEGKINIKVSSTLYKDTGATTAIEWPKNFAKELNGKVPTLWIQRGLKENVGSKFFEADIAHEIIHLNQPRTLLYGEKLLHIPYEYRPSEIWAYTFDARAAEKGFVIPGQAYTRGNIPGLQSINLNQKIISYPGITNFGYVGLSYMGYGYSEELSIGLGGKKPTSLVFNEPGREPITTTAKALRGQEVERQIAVGTGISTSGPATQTLLGFKVAYFQPSEILRGGEKPTLGIMDMSSIAKLGRYYITEPMISSAAAKLLTSEPPIKKYSIYFPPMRELVAEPPYSVPSPSKESPMGGYNINQPYNIVDNYQPPPETPRYPGPTIPVGPPFAEMFKWKEKKRKPIFGKVKAYAVLIKRRGKYQPVAFGLPRAKALKFGTETAMREIARSFKVVESGMTEEPDIGTFFVPGKQFRQYKVKRGRKIGLVDEFIQRQNRALTSQTERQSLQQARRGNPFY